MSAVLVGTSRPAIEPPLPGLNPLVAPPLLPPLVAAPWAPAAARWAACWAAIAAAAAWCRTLPPPAPPPLDGVRRWPVRGLTRSSRATDSSGPRTPKLDTDWAEGVNAKGSCGLQLVG